MVPRAALTFTTHLKMRTRILTINRQTHPMPNHTNFFYRATNMQVGVSIPKTFCSPFFNFFNRNYFCPFFLRDCQKCEIVIVNLQLWVKSDCFFISIFYTQKFEQFKWEVFRSLFSSFIFKFKLQFLICNLKFR